MITTGTFRQSWERQGKWWWFKTCRTNPSDHARNLKCVRGSLSPAKHGGRPGSMALTCYWKKSDWSGELKCTAEAQSITPPIGLFLSPANNTLLPWHERPMEEHAGPQRKAFISAPEGRGRLSMQEVPFHSRWLPRNATNLWYTSRRTKKPPPKQVNVT